MNLSDILVSFIRTFVPVGVGIGLAWVSRTLGWSDEATSAALTSWLVGACIAGYYTLARIAESYYPWLGWLLGAPKAPTYDGASK